MDVNYAPVLRVAYTLSVVDRSLIYEEVLYRLIWPGRMLSWSNSMSSDGVVFLRKCGDISCGCLLYTHGERYICFDGYTLCYNIQRGVIQSYTVQLHVVWEYYHIKPRGYCFSVEN